jgi:nitrite reductase/ring-hydroxylating ferredoxin subunit
MTDTAATPSDWPERLADLRNGTACSLNLPGEPQGAFAVRHAGQTRIWRNACPHTGAPLNWLPDVFLSLDGKHIQCSLHGALFEPDTGRCIYGPCLGRHLEPIAAPA